MTGVCGTGAEGLRDSATIMDVDANPAPDLGTGLTSGFGTNGALASFPSGPMASTDDRSTFTTFIEGYRNVSQVPPVNATSDNVGDICHNRPFVSTCDASMNNTSMSASKCETSIQVPHSREGLLCMDVMSMDAQSSSPNNVPICKIDECKGGAGSRKVKKFVQKQLSAFSFSRATKRKH